MPGIYDPSQVEDNAIETRSHREPRFEFSEYDDFLYATSPASRWDQEGTIANADLRGGVMSYTTGAVAGNRSRVNGDTVGLPIDPTKDFILIWRARTTTVVQVQKFFGAYSALPTAAAPAVEGAHAIEFRALDAAGAVNIFAVCRAASVETAVDLGVLDDASFHDFKIKKTGAQVQFFIDGVLKATITTNIPTNQLIEGVTAVTQEAVAKILQVDTFYLWNKR